MNDNLFAYEKPFPCFRIPFRIVPSWNDIISADTFSKNPNQSAKMNMTSENIKKWRKRGRERGVEIFREHGLKIALLERELRSKDKHTGKYKVEYFDGLETPYFTEPIACIIRVWRPSNAEYDVHNIVAKSIIDGLNDVRLFPKDSFRAFPELGFCFEGVDTSLKLTPQEAQERKEYLDRWRNRNANPPRLPLPSRFYFDFYKLSRLQFGTIYQFQTIG